ncbi:MAG: biopolymer transporter ExbD [Fibrobacter sp.]|jgi:Biopolymer transport protein ExbD/TolR.|uniref:ExbD/TolR family protein n=1 Tax=Fibrobacter sp. UWB5 TaxID=1964360 RepID=UPI000B5256E0|nr:biopolymer transporter ExbD [Fibrobacter sp. UWB5]MBR4679517.1 biopolymer transporter ExbD [Fibrobacter sp.]OWV12274.1 biopolymer transporter ExbD [Fibrobacter sp. UWB5]
MARQLKKPAKPEEPDLLPAMGLFTILIPMLLSMTAFSKLAIVEINMPERSMMNMDNETPPEPDQQALNLSLAITSEYLVIGARGGFQPNVYFKEMWTFRCKSDAQLITYAPEDVKSAVESGHGPKCKDGSEMDKEKYLYEIESIELWAINKESEEDPGRVIWAVYSSQSENVPDSAYVDGNNAFLAAPGEGAMGLTPPPMLKKPSAGAVLATLTPNSARTLKPDVAAKNIIYPLSAYDLIAKDLIQIHTQFIDLEDVDNIIIVANDDTQFDKIIQLMDRAKEAGFSKINLAKLGG